MPIFQTARGLQNTILEGAVIGRATGLTTPATSAAELGEALRQALRPKYQALDTMGAIVADGTAGTEELELQAGVYTVKILTSPIQTFSDVKIAPAETTQVFAIDAN